MNTIAVAVTPVAAVLRIRAARRGPNGTAVLLG
ncbi:hypothetical protein SAMN04489810_3276 [Microbacterium pygmaeum]|uniref:Uncharacterized protein n=1 Tax=Microbacterium pygmaeum TaxID=370764 RepID=A0A1G8D7X6_9MICO|nr:hypothetical protein SAMN04489810_3276 [Microbacterium pygmaeum]